jgi:hypothetical protein
VLFPQIERRHVDHGYEGNVVILDGCASHESEWFLDKTLARFVILRWLPLQSSDKTQLLDPGLF